MTAGGSSGAAKPGPPPQVWFPDTSALVTMAVHPPLHAAVVSALTGHQLVLAKAVVGELRSLVDARGIDPVPAWAAQALTQLGWLPQPVPLDDPRGTDLAVDIQEELAAGRPLVHPLQHWGEAAIIAMGMRAQTFRPLMLSDDYDARVAARARGVAPVSVHKLLHLMVRQKKLSAATAASYAHALHVAGRAGRDYSAEEIELGRIGRVGQP